MISAAVEVKENRIREQKISEREGASGGRLFVVWLPEVGAAEEESEPRTSKDYSECRNDDDDDLRRRPEEPSSLYEKRWE